MLTYEHMQIYKFFVYDYFFRIIRINSPARQNLFI